jgi:polyisoprenoid-binding protein YceI
LRAPALVLLLVGASLALAGCGPQPERPTAPAASTDRIPAPTGVACEIDPERSVIRILVRRGGPMARLGHNHVIEARQLHGTLWDPGNAQRASFDVHLPVASFLIDAPAARREAGEEFPGEIPPGDIEGTRRNLLGPALLQAEQFPDIRLESLGIAGPDATLSVTARVTIRGEAHEIYFPARLVREAGTLTVEGEFSLRHADLGLQPFSVMLGALQVQDELQIRYQIVAAPQAH